MMHLVFLIEDSSGKKMLENLLPRIFNSSLGTYVIHSYKGIGGKIPRDFHLNPAEIKHRILLANLPRLLSGLGKTFKGYGETYHAAVIVICDLDKRDRISFTRDLQHILERCQMPPVTRFCLAVEEGEAWLLGDPTAVQEAYPNCNRELLNSYVPDSICNTWELLADIVCEKGSRGLIQGGYQMIGSKKCEWAEKITPNIDINRNDSPSFQNFRSVVSELQRTEEDD